MNRRNFLASISALLANTSLRLPANRNIKWALSMALWSHFPPCPLTDILDVMKETGFVGIRLTGFPHTLENYGMTAGQLEREISKRNLHVVTVSFNAPLQDPARRQYALDSARAAMKFLAGFGASNLVVFSPSRRAAGAGTEAAFREMCQRCNQIGELAGEMGFAAGLHNHLGQMVQTSEELDRFMAMTDPKLFGLSPDTAHLHLAGANVVRTLEKYKSRVKILDYKDAKWTTPTADWVEPHGKVYPKNSTEARFLSSIYDLGDGEIDFPACHRVLKSVQYRGWLIVDLDAARHGVLASYHRCDDYVTTKLEPIYA
jgi:inosose dehydratase